MSNDKNNDILENLENTEDIQETHNETSETVEGTMEEVIENTESAEEDDTEVIEHLEDLGEKFNKSIVGLRNNTSVKTSKFRKSMFMRSVLIAFIAMLPIVSYIAYDEALGQTDPEHKTVIEKVLEKKVPSELLSDYKPTVLNVGFDNSSNTLTYDIEQANVKLEKYYININKELIDKWTTTDLSIDTSSFKDSSEDIHGRDFNFKSIDCYNNFLYIHYLNSTGTAARDIIVSDNIDTSGLNINDMKSLDDKLYEYTDDTTVMSFIESYNDSFIFYSEAIASGKLATKTLSNRLSDTENSFTYTNVDESVKEDVVINFDGAGTLNLGDLTNFKGAPGVYLSTTDGILRMYNYEDDEAYAFVTYVDNDSFMCEAKDLLETNYENLFVCDGFDDIESIGYRTFAIKGTKNQLYVFRVLEIADEQLVVDMLKAFGIDKSEIKLSVIQQSVDVEDIEKVENNEAEDTTSEDNTVTEN